jgi:hypothetical protein
MQRWRRHCWKVAKRQLLRPLPLETVRRRVRRAAELGLAYRRYELLVLGGGEIEAMLFAGETLVVTAPYTSPAEGLDARVVARLSALTGCRKLLLAGPHGTDPVWTASGPLFDGAIRVASRGLLAAPPVKADRDAVLAGLRERILPAHSVALVGSGDHGPAWVAGARLAGFVPGSEFFGV